jgi:aminoglycoside 3-N-acetyltransferase
MGEQETIGASERPVTATSLAADLRRLGVEPDMTLMVHTSLSRLGFVVGGEQAVVDALLDALGPAGTLMMPTHSTGLTDPAGWRNPPVPDSWWEIIRAAMPAYDRDLTPTRDMGVVAEHFRHRRGVRRSDHPTVSAAAVGPNAATLVDGHQLDRGLGEGSPQARLYDLDGHVLLLGVGHANNTSLHLSEYRSVPADHPLAHQRSPVHIDGERVWVDHDEIDEDNDFDRIGADFAATGRQRSGAVGAGTAHLMRCREIVDFATDWLRTPSHP